MVPDAPASKMVFDVVSVLHQRGTLALYMDDLCVNQMVEGRSPAGCDTLPMFDVLEAQEKETGNEED